MAEEYELKVKFVLKVKARDGRIEFFNDHVEKTISFVDVEGVELVDHVVELYRTPHILIKGD